MDTYRSHKTLTMPIVYACVSWSCHVSHVYVRTVVSSSPQWFSEGRLDSPVTHQELPNLTLTPDADLRTRINEYLKLSRNVTTLITSRANTIHAGAAEITGEIDLIHPLDQVGIDTPSLPKRGSMLTRASSVVPLRSRPIVAGLCPSCFPATKCPDVHSCSAIHFPPVCCVFWLLVIMSWNTVALSEVTVGC